MVENYYLFKLKVENKDWKVMKDKTFKQAQEEMQQVWDSLPEEPNTTPDGNPPFPPED